ncbi:hypothetical protein B0T18DRAFT_406462 [Schizothecium vesticola]|uniref:Uncharacterized protein n=1 Tax=Schizothecium vesticola TaxID=314040 RepID=A0AA40F1C8_9PEZI|nr:hypothetical protein B0T18DRAFT_406462 [Schizothecium vesticola]
MVKCRIGKDIVARMTQVHNTDSQRQTKEIIASSSQLTDVDAMAILARRPTVLPTDSASHARPVRRRSFYM